MKALALVALFCLAPALAAQDDPAAFPLAPAALPRHEGALPSRCRIASAGGLAAYDFGDSVVVAGPAGAFELGNCRALGCVAARLGADAVFLIKALSPVDSGDAFEFSLVAVLPGKGGMRAQTLAKTEWGVTSWPSIEAAAHDLDGDGHDDAVSASCSGGILFFSVAFAYSGGAFAPLPFYNGAAPVVAAEALNIRQTPSAAAPKLTMVPAGARMTTDLDIGAPFRPDAVAGRRGYWVRVVYEPPDATPVTGYVFSPYIKPE